MVRLNLTIRELCDLVEGDTTLNPAASDGGMFLVKHIASLEEAQEHDIAVFFDPEEKSVFDSIPLERVRASKAGIILASKPIVDADEVPLEKEYVLVKDPIKALEKLESFVANRKDKKEPKLHRTAFIDEFAVVEDEVSVGPYAVIQDDAKVGFGAKIGASAFIGRGCQIGCNAVIHPGARILDRCVIGDNTIIHSGAVVGSDGFGYRVMTSGLRKVPHLGIVRIGRNVEIGANATIDRSEFSETVIEDGVKIDNNVHIAHNVKIGRGTAILAQTGIAGSTVIGQGCQIGGQVAIKDHIKIGNGVKIVSKSAVMKNLKDGEVVCGIPSMPFNQWKRMMVAVAKLPEFIRPLRMMKDYVERKQKKEGFLKSLFK